MKALAFAVLLAVLSPAAAWGQVATSDNPLAVLKEEVKRVLEEAHLPFTAEQESAIIIMMEDRRQATEGLFGGLLDFRNGPTQGQEADRLQSAIDWMRTEFLGRLQDYLNAEQLAAWTRYVEAVQLQAPPVQPQRRAQQTQYVRINNNAFTAEDMTYRFGQGGVGQASAEVIQRGGGGSFHGTAQFLAQDEALNARNPFAANKPPYQERRTSVTISGPTIPGRLTTTLLVTQNEIQNVDTVNAATPAGSFALGITRPARTRVLDAANTYQLTAAHSLALNLHYGDSRNRNLGIGGFTLPERASESSGHDWRVELVQFSNFSSRTLYETRFTTRASHAETTPLTEGLRINVLDAFNSGGAQNETRDDNRSYTFSNLFTRFGENVTIKGGALVIYRDEHAFSRANFDGTFVFSSLAAYRAGTPVNFRINLGTPTLDARQVEMSVFLQNDLRLTPRFTLMYGGRYDAQTNLADHNNVSPRLGFAYGLGQASVIRGGAGFFYNRLPIAVVKDQQRFDGTRQYEIIVDNPSFPDPFQGGSIRQVAASLRVTEPRLQAPQVFTTLISAERTFFSNLLLSAAYDYQREYHRYRLRNLNAPYDRRAAMSPVACTLATPDEMCVRPDPTRGNVNMLEASANELRHTLKLTGRKRFSIFNVTATYQLQHVVADTPPNNPDLPTDNYDLLADWEGARAGGFPRHSLNTSLNAQLPLGVFLSGAMVTNNGGYYNITTGRDDNRDGNVNDRPAGVPRNSGERPKALEFNFNVSKAFYFTAASGPGTRTNLNVFANVTNAFNRLNPGAPSGVMTSPNFGRVTSAVNPREIELGIRFQF